MCLLFQQLSLPVLANNHDPKRCKRFEVSIYWELEQHDGFLVYNFLKDCTLSCKAETMTFYFCFIKKLVHQEHRILCSLHTSSMRLFQAFSKSGPTKQQCWHSGLVWFSGLAGSWRLVKYANTIPPGAISTARLLRKLSKSSMLCWANSRAIVGLLPRIQERPLL